MPFLCEIEISGPRADDEGGMIADAVLAAVQEGWRSPRLDVGEDGVALDEEAGDAEVLDYQVLGYPGGAFVLVVIPDMGLDSAALAASALARHLVTWSPALLAYTVDKLLVTPVDEPYDEENWLPPFQEPEPAPAATLTERLSEDVRALGARHLLAGALASLWFPGRGGHGGAVRAEDVVAGAVEPPWDRELVNELGTLLIRAGALEVEAGGDRPKLIGRGGGDPALAEELLARTRAAVAGGAYGDDEAAYGRDLLSTFAHDHDLAWDTVRLGEAEEDHEARSERQLRALLWAGMRAFATLAAPLAGSGVWSILDALGDDDAVTAYARWEHAELQESAVHDGDEIAGASAALSGMWIAVRRPELLDDFTGPVADTLQDDASPLVYLACSALLLAGSGPVRAAVADERVPADLRPVLNGYTDALAAVEAGDDEADHFGRLLEAAEDVLLDGGDLAERTRILLTVAGIAARLVATDETPRHGPAARIGNARDLTVELMSDPARHGIVVLDDEKAGTEMIRLHALAAVADADPAAAGDMAADFPDLLDEDPRTEPAARERARRWILAMLDLADRGGEVPAAELFSSQDAHLLTYLVQEGEPIPPDWDVVRATSAAAVAVADLAAAYGLGEELPWVFADA